MRRLAVAFVALACSCGCPDRPLPEAPGAQAVVVARAADVVRLGEALAAAKVIDGASLRAVAPSLIADAPVVASRLPNGAVVVATRVRSSAKALATGARPVMGDTMAVVWAGEPALARVDGDRVLLALRVPPAEEITVAALLEVMAADRAARTPALPPLGTLVGRIAEVSPGVVGEATVTARLLGGGVIALQAESGRVSQAVRTALASESPPWACALDEGAAAVLAVPPVDVAALNAESFAGRLLVAVYPPDSSDPDGAATVVLAGVPRDAQAREGLVSSLRTSGVPVSERTEGARTLLTLEGGAGVHAVVEDELFVVGAGERALVERVTSQVTCGDGERPLVRAHGRKLQRLLLPLFVTPEAIARALGAMANGDDPIPLARWAGVERLTVDGQAVGEGVRLDARLELATGPE